MKTNKTFAYGILSVILALAFIACPDEKTPESNPPVAHAQAEPTHTLANDLTIALNGTVSTGNITAYAWECASYTADQGTVSAVYSTVQVDALIANANTATATVAPRKAGTYVFKLTVTDNDGEIDTDTVAVVVEAANVTVNLAQFDLSVGVPISLDLTPTKGTGWEGFDYNKLSFTLSETSGGIDADPTSYYQYDNTTGIVSIPTGYSGHPWPPCPRITQTFIYAGKEIGRLGFNLRAEDAGSGQQFYKLYQWDPSLGNPANVATAADNLNAFSPLTLTISEVE